VPAWGYRTGGTNTSRTWSGAEATIAKRVKRVRQSVVKEVMMRGGGGRTKREWNSFDGGLRNVLDFIYAKLKSAHGDM
jgi:hypothetical protein